MRDPGAPCQWGRLLLGVAALSVMTACGQNGGQATSASDAQTVRIGIDLPVSGADATDGLPTRNGVILAIEQANAHGLPGGLKIGINDLDDAVNGKHDPAQGAQNVKTFIADPSVLAMIGPFNSSVATSEIPLTNDAGLGQISPSATNDGLTIGETAKQLRRSQPDTNSFFRVCTTDGRQGDADAKFANTLHFHRVFVIDDNETYGKGLADVFSTRFAATGGTVLGREHITANQQDFKALLTKVRAANPDLLFFGGTTSTGGGLVRKQMGDVGLGTVAFLGGDGISDDEFRSVAGALADNVYFTVVAPDVTHLPSARTFVADYLKRFQVPAGPYSANAFAAALIEIAAIRNATAANHGSLPTRAQVLAQIAHTKALPTPIGPLSFDAAGDTTSPIVSLYRVSGGKRRFVGQNLK